MAYWVFLIAVLGLPLMRDIEAVEPFASAAFEETAHRSLAAINGLRLEADAESDLQSLGESALIAALGQIALFYGERRREERSLWAGRSGRPLVGPFASMKPGELQLLAERDRGQIERYGEKRVERRFEDQLTLLVQSLGFVVVRARPGERKVDLLCISGGGGEPYTFLLEAKTSGRGYGFPSKDERALAEYVRTVRRTLDTLPTLKFVLLVGPSAARGLEAKLRRVEAENAVPIRFLAAEELVQLREGLPGPVRAGAFQEAVLGGPPIMSAETIEGLVAGERVIEGRHADLVRAMLDPLGAAAEPALDATELRRRLRTP
jgi:hypothetical protein